MAEHKEVTAESIVLRDYAIEVVNLRLQVARLQLAVNKMKDEQNTKEEE